MKASTAFEKHFLLVTLSIVTILGVPTALSLFSSPQKIDVDPGLSSGRLPSSINLIQDKKSLLSLGSSISHEIGCESQVDLGSVTGAHLRLKSLKGLNCSGDMSNVQVLNKTNGFTAETILLKQGQFTTDFIDLSEGDNLIEISSLNLEGVKTLQIIKVNRSPASKNE